MPARLKSHDAIIARLGEVFREFGFEGASMAQITKATGLGKGSLYHAFPGGKDEMAKAVLADIDAWFEDNVFAPTRDTNTAPLKAVVNMLAACDSYFQGGGRVCLVGAFALADTRERFPKAINAYFARWKDALQACLKRGGLSPSQSKARAEEILARIQGALIMAQALDDPAYFGRELSRVRKMVQADLKSH